MKGILENFYAKIGITSELPCVILFGMAFMFVFAGFDTQAYVTETALQSISKIYPDRMSTHAGYYGMCITYFFFTLMTFFTPLVVSYLTAKWTMFLASVFYTIFMLTFMLVNSLIFYMASALMGIAAALIWTGHGVYMKEITASGNESRNSGLHWSINFGSLIFGGILLLIIFREAGEVETLSVEIIRYIFGGLSVFTILSNILFALLPNYSKRCVEKRVTYSTTIGKSIRLFCDAKTYLLAVSFLFMGLSLSFYITIYPSCLFFSKSIIGSCFISYMSNRVLNFGYLPTMLIALPLYFTAFIAIYLAFPFDANLKPTTQPTLTLWLVIGMLICMGDSCWNTLRTAVLTKMYGRENSPQSIATCASFFYSAVLNLHIQILIQALVLLAGSICFAIAWMIHLREIKIVASTKENISIANKNALKY
ncbi:unnamed protein product [Thelazia callipaeda]|uniref:DUF2955 domain-containing protein n=1 Tax=Thelazia callipaeda TaxID=103827 RepID=A0A158RB21_THECL|nr:unnamed protein product [Thelazia callipaeda]